jgi:5-formyltetrahydrofolate cyclo-ligase
LPTIGIVDTIAQAKIALRRELRRRRLSLGDDERRLQNAAICAALCRMVLASGPVAVASYLAQPDEVDLDSFHRSCWHAGIPVYLPRVVGPGRLTWHRLRAAHDLSHLQSGTHNLREPDPRALPEQPLPERIPMIVPGVAFTADGRRLGQGGGFYDRILGSTGCMAVGVGFSCQLVDDLPVEPHDLRVSALIIGGRVVF